MQMASESLTAAASTGERTFYDEKIANEESSNREDKLGNDEISGTRLQNK